jgi:hypothetical protein
VSFSLAGKSISLRRIIVIAAVLALYVVLIVISFNMGKGYFLYIDNSDSEDGLVLALDGVRVSLNGAEALEYYPKDRDRIMVLGAKHKLSIEVLSDESKYEKQIDVKGLSDNILVSIPKLVAGIEPAVSVFKPFVYVAPEEPFVPGTIDGSVNPDAQPTIVP